MQGAQQVQGAQHVWPRLSGQGGASLDPQAAQRGERCEGRQRRVPLKE